MVLDEFRHATNSNVAVTNCLDLEDTMAHSNLIKGCKKSLKQLEYLNGLADGTPSCETCNICEENRSIRTVEYGTIQENVRGLRESTQE